MAMNNQKGECPHCGKEFDHLPAHKWQCPEKPDEDEENDVKESETDDSDEPDQDLETVESDPDNDIDQSSSDDESDSNAGVIVDKVKPQETDTRKNKEETKTESEDDSDDWVEIDYNSGKQVKTIMQTTDIGEPRGAQKLLKAFKTGNAEDIPQFDEIRLSDGELR